MKIALITGYFFKEMKEANKLTLMSLADYYKSKGHEVTILCSGGLNQKKFEKVEGIYLYRGPYWKTKYVVPIFHPGFIFNQVFSPIIAYYNSRKKFDVIHSFSSSPLLALRSIIPKIFNPPLVAIHSIKSFSKYGGRNFFIKYIYLNILDVVITNLFIIKKYLVCNGVNNNKVKVIRSHISENIFYQKTASEKRLLKKKYGYRKNKVVLYYGPLVDRKGIMYLIKSFSLVSEKYADAKLVLCCKHAVKLDEHINRVKRLMIMNNIDKSKVDFVKFGVNIEDYVNIADVVVMPYPKLVGTEGNPSCILESMACGTPVVTSDLPELREFLTDDEVYFAKAKDAKSLSEKISEIFVDKQLMN